MVVSVIWIGSMVPFWTRLPIQSCAPITRSGALPAWEAVTYCVCRSLETAWTLTWTSLSSPHLVADSLIAREYLSSAQMVRETPSEPLSDAPPPLPQPARSTISPAISRARVVRRTRMMLLELSAPKDVLDPTSFAHRRA